MGQLRTTRAHRRLLAIGIAAAAALAGGLLTSCDPPARPVAAPYVDVAGSNPANLKAAVVSGGLRDVSLGFVIGDGCTPTWDDEVPVSESTAINARIDAARTAGAKVIVSFGGQAGLDLARTCTDTTKLAAAYRSVLARFGATRADFDVEGDALDDAASISRRFTAIRALVATTPSLQVSATLPVAPSGLEPNGLAFLRKAKATGTRIDLVNIMVMDYGDARDMGATAISSAMGTLAQWKAISPSASYAKLGLTPMIGRNDTASEVFSLANARAVISWARANGVGRLAFWSLNRDQQCAGATSTAQDDCSGVSQGTLAFTKLLVAAAKP
ncbi:chitinase [Aquihabitans sp. G128]|uniref:chitinase n=1 Tax=Aquihabitans sp. G128 TaxID=2849779 RepID=UPI001C2117F2|nr:chitinase [Aquihabitans sp. G128]QXC61767.1 chitinase [Aquihabitans sp. G128]